MKSKLALVTMLAAALVAPAALPCGAPFGNGINIDPAQDIVVVHKKGIETYVFQPRFCGSAKEFGLVLPVPAKLSKQPELSKAEVLTKLVKLSEPQHVASTQCGYPNWGVGGSSGTAGTGSTTVVSSGTVGFMDYAQLEASSIEALTDWLDANGYPYDSQAESAFDYYVKKGWLFVTFKVSQGELTGTTTCKDLGPVKLSFPTDIPVVPTRMATARGKDTNGVLSYASSFSWRIFGITTKSQQLGFANGSSSSRVLNYSGALADADLSALDGLAASGDRATRMTISFSYGSTDPDLGLGLVSGQDYREVINDVTYVECKDGGVDVAVMPPFDAPVDSVRHETGLPVWDSAAVTVDAAVVQQPDAAPAHPDTAVVVTLPPEAKTDSGVVQVPPETGRADAGAVTVADAASAVKRDASEPTKKESSGCSLVGSGATGGFLPALLALGLLLRRRRR